MNYYAGLDVSLEETAICIVDEAAHNASTYARSLCGSMPASTVSRRVVWRDSGGRQGERDLTGLPFGLGMSSRSLAFTHWRKFLGFP